MLQQVKKEQNKKIYKKQEETKEINSELLFNDTFYNNSDSENSLTEFIIDQE